MMERQFSRTAHGVALRRALHQMVDHPRVLDDPVAVTILGQAGAAEIAEAQKSDPAPAISLRAFVVARSRFAEDQLAVAFSHGVRQFVVLGAGLDTFACRNPFNGLKVFEVDHPATQSWKRQLLRDAGIAEPPALRFVPVDFEKEALPQALAGAGFRGAEAALFSWLGVTPYLARETVLETLRWIISICPRNGVVFDHGVPRESLSVSDRTAFDELARRVSALGEPFVSSFNPAELTREMGSMGYAHIENLSAEDINSRYFRDRADGLRVSGGGRLACGQGAGPGSRLR